MLFIINFIFKKKGSTFLLLSLFKKSRYLWFFGTILNSVASKMFFNKFDYLVMWRLAATKEWQFRL